MSRRLVVLLGCIVFIAIPGIAQSGLTTLYGPEQFVRSKGKPKIEEQQFSPAGFEAPFVLHLRNGDENGDHRVSSAWVWLNGKPIFDPSSFNQQVSGCDVEVTLTDPSVLQVKVASKLGSKLTMWIDGTPTNVRTVGPEGGTFEFPNGVILDIPAGAVTEETEIEVTDLPIEQVNEMMSQLHHYFSREGRCLGGFVAKPDGLEFNVPIRAIVPVLSLYPHHIPVQAEVDFDEGKYWIARTDLLYLGDEGLVEIKMDKLPLSGEAIIELSNPEWKEKCTKCESYDTPECADPLKVDPNCCNLYNHPKFGKDSRMQCAPWCTECCKEKRVKIVCDAVDFSQGDCNIVSDSIEVTYLDCPGEPTFQSELKGKTLECPEGVEKLIVEPASDTIYVCEEIELRAKLSVTADDGSIYIFDDYLPGVYWESGKPNVVEAISDPKSVMGRIIGLSESIGPVTITASATKHSDIKGTAEVTVIKPDLEILPPPNGDNFMAVGEKEEWLALCTDCIGDLVWGTDRPDILALTEIPGYAVEVTALSNGAAKLMAKLVCGVPEPIVYQTTITVECPQISFTVDPSQLTIIVGEGRILEAKLFDEQNNPLDASTVTWSSDAPNTAEVIIPEGELTSVEGIAPGPATITATYQDDCQTKQATAEVTVECPPSDAWHVDGGVTSSGDGKTWGGAFETIQEAIYAAGPGDEIWVKMGTYAGGITMSKNVELYGGFDGTECTGDERDWVSNLTEIVGGLHVLHVTADATIDGLTITRGIAPGTSSDPFLRDYKGGGIYAEAPLTVRNCRFVENLAGTVFLGYGGGIYSEVHLTAINCEFLYNEALLEGGAIHYGIGTLDVSGCSFVGNEAPFGPDIFPFFP